MFVQGPSQELDTIMTNQQEVLRNLNELRWALGHALSSGSLHNTHEDLTTALHKKRV